MRLRLYKMEIEGKVAVANLGLVGLVLVVFLIADGVVNTDTTSEGMLTFKFVLHAIIMVLTFPVGWLSNMCTGVSGPPVTAVIFVPLNAYLWGYIVAAVVRRRKSRRECAGSADDTAGRS